MDIYSVSHLDKLSKLYEPVLLEAGVANPKTEISAIIDHVLKSSVANDDRLSFATALLERRARREPIERLIGKTDFLGLAIELSPAVFRPIAETEATVEHALIEAQRFSGCPIRVLDIGTGSGCMLLSLLSKLPNASGVGIDISADAIKLAKSNAASCGVESRARFIQSDWSSLADEKFDIIISNPPRIPSQDVSRLVREVSDYDPRDALDGGIDGLNFYRFLADRFIEISSVDAFAVIQVGELILDDVFDLFKKSGFRKIEIRTDYKFSPNCIYFERPQYKKSKKSREYFLNFVNKLRGAM